MKTINLAKLGNLIKDYSNQESFKQIWMLLAVEKFHQDCLKCMLNYLNNNLIYLNKLMNSKI